MFELKQTDTFRKWWGKLKDHQARGLMAARLNRLAYGFEGDVKPVGAGVMELRIHTGPGYRIYYHRKGDTIVILLVALRLILMPPCRQMMNERR